MEDNKGYLIYPIDNLLKNSIEDNPNFLGIINFIKHNYSSQNYKIYRAGQKITTLKNLLNTSNIPYKLVVQILERNYLNLNSDDSLPVFPKKLREILHEIFTNSQKLNYVKNDSDFNLDQSVAVMSNFIWNVFDPFRNHPISLLELKETLLIFCDVSSMDEMIFALFQLVSDHNRCISKFRFECLMSALMKILSYIDEHEAYGDQDLNILTEQCFAESPGILGINEYQFYCLWTTSQTKFLIYANLLALLKRMKDAEKLIHNFGCASCGTERVQGIGFRCSTCKELTLCMRCFALGYENKKHLPGHRMREVYTEEIPQKKWTDYLLKLLRIICIFKPKNSNRIDETELITSDKNSTIAPFEQVITKNETVSEEKEKSETSFGASSNSTISISENLQSIVEKILKENETIIYHKNCLDVTKQKNLYEFLESHQDVLNLIAEKLRILLNNCRLMMYPTSSTPNRRMSLIHPRLNSSQNLSKSINGAEINRTYLEDNKSDYSIRDLSTFLHQHKNLGSNFERKINHLTVVSEISTEMNNFKEVLNKVKEICEDDGHLDNTELALATENLEQVLDKIIRGEEIKRGV